MNADILLAVEKLTLSIQELGKQHEKVVHDLKAVVIEIRDYKPEQPNIESLRRW